MKLEDYISEAISHGKRTGYYVDVDSETPFIKFADILKSARLIQYKKCASKVEYERFRSDAEENMTPEFFVDTVWKTITVFLPKQKIEWEIEFEYFDAAAEHRVDKVYKYVIDNGKTKLVKSAKSLEKKEVNDLLSEMCRSLEEEF
jgi:hypothetical protein